jgi:hypothetical protein
VFRWLALVLLAYVGAAMLAKPDFGEVLRGTVIPTIEFNRDFLTMMVAVIGTTLSAYLYSWQSDQEVEEEIAAGRTTISRPRIDDSGRHAGGPQHAKRQPLVPTGCLHRDKGDLVLLAERRQLGNPGGVAREALDRPVAAEPGLERGAADIYSTSNIRHDNLPCPCDRQSSDCSVVRDTAAGGPKAHPRLLPEVGRAPHAAHAGRWPPARVQRRSDHKPAPISRYKVGRAANLPVDPPRPTLSPRPGGEGSIPTR